MSTQEQLLPPKSPQLLHMEPNLLSVILHTMRKPVSGSEKNLKKFKSEQLRGKKRLSEKMREFTHVFCEKQDLTFSDQIDILIVRESQKEAITK